MRLLVLTSSYPTAQNPGGGIFIRHLLEHLPQQVRITVVTPDTAAPQDSHVSSDGVTVKWVRYAPRPLQRLSNSPGGMPAALKASPWLAALLPIWAMAMFVVTARLAARHDVIHAHWSVCGLIGGIVGGLSGTPATTTLHGTDVDWAERFVLFRWILRLCLAVNGRVVAVSSAMAERLQMQWPQRHTKIQTVYNGIAPEFFAAATRRSGVRKDSIVFAVVGSLVESKHVDQTIHAFHRIVKEGHPVRLVIAGDGPLDAALKHQAHRLNLNRHIKFFGAITPEQVAQLMARVDVLVLSSAHEGRPTVVMEAMAAGAAVVASDIDGVRELINHRQTGLLFPPGDIRGLCRHLNALVQQPKTIHLLAQRAQRWIDEQGLTWRNTARRYLEIYRRAAGEGR